MNKRKSCSNEAVGVECMLWQEMDWAEHHCSGSGRIQYLKQRSIVLKKDAEGWFRGIFLPRKPISSPFVLWILPTLLLICEERALTNKLCLTKFLWEVLRYTQSGFALVLLQIPVFLYWNWRNGNNKRVFQCFHVLESIWHTELYFYYFKFINYRLLQVLVNF